MVWNDLNGLERVEWYRYNNWNGFEWKKHCKSNVDIWCRPSLETDVGSLLLLGLQEQVNFAGFS
jgi:hypothetical protein